MVKKRQKIKQKIKLFYKISLFILLFAAIIFSYFIIVLSNKPRSFEFVDKKIATFLSSNLENKVKIRKSYVSITGYGSVRIIMKDIEANYQNKAGEDRKLSILQAETEFSPFDLILARFSPNNIKIINPEIVVDDLYGLDVSNLQAQDASKSELNDYISVAQIGLAALRDGKVAIKNFVIENAKILIKNPDSNTEILIKKSDTKISLQDDIWYFSSSNKIDILNDDIEMNSNCQLSDNDLLKCNVLINNFIASSIANIHPKLKFLNNINGNFNLMADLHSKQGSLFDANFKLSSAIGSFEFLNFFSDKINFKNLTINGNIDGKVSSLFLSEVSAEFDQTKFLMSLLFSNYNDPQNQILDFDIDLKNLPGDDIKKLWPVFLRQKGIRDWVTTHVKGGVVNEAHTKFRLNYFNQDNSLATIEARLNFNNLNLKYSDYFPEITNIDGVADFSKDDMKIVLTKGDVLNSKITQGLVAIDNFHVPNVVLKINGNSEGLAEDLLKHINYQAKFSDQISKYFNGTAISNFKIDLPIEQNFSIRDVELRVGSIISNFNNSFVKGDLNLSVKKNSASNDFVGNIDLTRSSLVLDQLDVNKNLNIKSGLDFTILAVNEKKMQIKNITLWQDDKNKNNQEIISKINASAIIENLPWLVTEVDLKNNSARNNYRLQYSADRKKSLQQVRLDGEKLDMENLIKNKSFIFIKNGDFLNLGLNLNINHLRLANNQKINNFHLNIDCIEKFCYKGLITASKGNNQPLINIKINKESNNNFSDISGSITEISRLIYGFNLSDKIISSGNTKITIKNQFINKKSIFEGDLRIYDGITFSESSEVKKIYHNQLLSKVKDDIVQNQKIHFDQLKVEFIFDDYALKIKSLIANNYKIGITAKGMVNLKDDSFKINGMIVPGYFINNLFGIGKIPLIGGVVRGLFTGGEGGGLFGIKYEYTKTKDQKEAEFKTNKLSAFIPVTIRNLFD
jgi:hypothetical protein